jgi:hypothetical protein
MWLKNAKHAAVVAAANPKYNHDFTSSASGPNRPVATTHSTKFNGCRGPEVEEEDDDAAEEEVAATAAEADADFEAASGAVAPAPAPAAAAAAAVAPAVVASELDMDAHGTLELERRGKK